MKLTQETLVLLKMYNFLSTKMSLKIQQRRSSIFKYILLGLHVYPCLYQISYCRNRSWPTHYL